MRLALIGFVLTLSSAACATDPMTGGGPDAGQGSGSGSGSGGGAVSPRAGQWHYSEFTPVTSTCATTVGNTQPGAFLVDQVTAGAFRIVPNDSTLPFTCTLSGASFDCPNRAAATQDYRPAVDAVLTIHATANGTFTDALHATGQQHATVDCAGTQCSAVATGLPCAFAVNFKVIAL